MAYALFINEFEETPLLLKAICKMSIYLEKERWSENIENKERLEDD